jgi:uncharacterized membrane protein
MVCCVDRLNSQTHCGRWNAGDRPDEQVSLTDLARDAELRGVPLSPQYWALARQWFWLGIVAFASVVIVLWLMVTKPD